MLNKMNAPEPPPTAKAIAAKLKAQVTDLKNMSIRKTQLQGRLDNVKSQYAALLQDMLDLQ